MPRTVEEQLRYLLNAPSPQGGEGLESAGTDLVGSLFPPDLHERVRTALSRSELESAGPADDTLEAIVLPGLRPAFDVRDGTFVAPELPAFWKDLNTFRSHLDHAIAATGRVELSGHPFLDYAGTAFAVSERHVLTNRHVAEFFVNGLGDADLVLKPGRTPGWDPRRESLEEPSHEVPVTGVALVHPFWDVAILEVDGLPALGLPRLELLGARPDDVAGRLVALVGYPTSDPRTGWSDQQRTFHDRFQVKRLAPGLLRGETTTTSFDHEVAALEHDASTLGGNSGSAVIDVATGRVWGLHFKGRYLQANFAIPAWELAREVVLRRSVSFADAAAPDTPIRVAAAPSDGLEAAARQVEATRQAADRHLADPDPARPVLVQIHGTLGAHLHSPNQWPSRVWLSPTELARGDLAERLALAGDGEHDAHWPADIAPTEPFGAVYGPARLAWRLRGYEVLGFAFDWRKGLARAADDLHRFLELEAGRRPGREFVLVAHSMGGLVAALYAQRHPEWASRVRDAILLGVPLGGTFAVVGALTGEGFARTLAAASTGDSVDDIRHMASTLPGLIDQLPDPAVFDAPEHVGDHPTLTLGVLFKPSTWAPVARPARRWLSQSALLKADLRSSPLLERATLVIGVRHATAASVDLSRPGEPRLGAHHETGDQTVPSRSAWIAGPDVYEASWPHTLLPAEPAVIAAVVDLVETGACALNPVSPSAIGKALPAPKAAPVSPPAPSDGDEPTLALVAALTHPGFSPDADPQQERVARIVDLLAPSDGEEAAVAALSTAVSRGTELLDALATRELTDAEQEELVALGRGLLEVGDDTGIDGVLAVLTEGRDELEVTPGPSRDPQGLPWSDFSAILRDAGDDALERWANQVGAAHPEDLLDPATADYDPDAVRDLIRSEGKADAVFARREPAEGTWYNYVGALGELYTEPPDAWFQQPVPAFTRPAPPTNVAELAAIVAGLSPQRRARVVGGGHSSTDVARPDHVLIDLSQLTDIALPGTTWELTAPRCLRADFALPTPWKAVRLPAGVIVRDGNRTLAAAGLAFDQLGSFDRQSLLGAILTGTHGSGASQGPLCDYLLSVDVMTVQVVGGVPTPTIFRVERADGPTDPAAFAAQTANASPRWELVRSTERFNAIVVSMGCMGVVFAAIVQVREQYGLSERRFVTRWDPAFLAEVRATHVPVFTPVKPRPVPRIPADRTQIEFLVNPYTNRVVYTRREVIPVPADQPDRPIDGHLIRQKRAGPSATRRQMTQLATVLTGWRNFLDIMLRGTARREDAPAWESLGYRVLKLGAGTYVTAAACEIAFPLDNVPAAMARLARLAVDFRRQGIHFTSPYGLRFVRSTPAWLAPQYSEIDEVFAMIEVPMILHTEGMVTLVERVARELTMPSIGGRPHWGQWNWAHAADVQRLWPDHAVAEWKSALRFFDPLGCFDNRFVRRTGLRG